MGKIHRPGTVYSFTIMDKYAKQAETPKIVITICDRDTGQDKREYYVQTFDEIEDEHKDAVAVLDMAMPAGMEHFYLEGIGWKFAETRDYWPRYQLLEPNLQSEEA